MRDDASTARPASIALVGGDLALNFANTVSGRDGAPVEHLRDAADVVAWARHVGILADERPTEMVSLLFDRALELRAAVAAIAAAISGGEQPPAKAGATLLLAHANAITAASARFAKGRLSIDFGRIGESASTAEILGPIAAAAVKLFSEADPARLKCCPAQNCGWFFLDATKNNSRRWCDMQVCGARSKVAAFRGRRRNLHSEGV
jgi:predicted RNA-binding Zn ribbon-like protein